RAVREALAPGVPDGVDGRRLTVAFAGASPSDTAMADITSRWIGEAALALGREMKARGIDGVRSGERSGAMIVALPVAPGAPEAPALVRAAILAVRPMTIDPRREIVTIPDTDLARWTRGPAPLTRASLTPAMLRAETGDGRWLWAIALALLVMESLV